MNDIESLDGVLFVDDLMSDIPCNTERTTADVDLTCTLRDHLNVDSTLGERSEHLASETDSIAHLLADKGENGHIFRDGDLLLAESRRGTYVTDLLEIPHQTVELLLVHKVLQGH
jgi:hypothetical protein